MPTAASNRLTSSSAPSLPTPTESGAPSTTTSGTATNAPAAATAPSPGDGEASSTTSGRRVSGNNAISAATTTTAAPSTPPSRPGFFSRLSFPLTLRNRNRHVSEFYIHSDDPYKKYSAGDSVKGAVVLVVQKPVRITHLTVALTGIVRVRKDPGVGKADTALALHSLPKGESERPQYHGNGLATLFQDEQVLSGEGRIESGKFYFNFDLMFPSKGLPSSIDFERGTIAYVVTATLTRPTSIAPTTSCDRKVLFVEKTDVGEVHTPQPKYIYLEPIKKRTRRKKSTGIDKAPLPPPDMADLASEVGSVSAVTDDSGRERAADQRTIDQSDIRSEVSGGSSRSVSTGGFSRLDYAQSKQQLVDDKTITAYAALNKGGVLPGDTISVKVVVQHIKHVKSMTGVIVTLYREGKINSSPPTSHFEDGQDEKRRQEKDEAYPKSRTGFSGMSLSSTGATAVFRKDFDQSTVPLIINPHTLQASVALSVRVPDDAFPTIRTVPAGMIRFNYWIEVIVDLGGKMPNLSQGPQPSRFGQDNNMNDGQSQSNFSRRGATIVDTQQFRQRKGCAAVKFEVIVGTNDSSRGRMRQRTSPSSGTNGTGVSDEDESGRGDNGYYEEPYNHYGTPYANGRPSSSYFTPPPNGQPYYASPPPIGNPSTSLPPQPYEWHLDGRANDAAPSYIPAPEIPNRQNMTEKERVRHAETTLLPSQPPAAPSEPSAPSAPSAPGPLSNEDDIYDADDTPRMPHATPSAPPTNDDVGEGPSAPSHDDIDQAPVGPVGPDKQEVERQRLMNEASGPPEMPEDMERVQDTTSRRDMAPDLAPSAPSAPVLDEEDEEENYRGYGVGAGPSTSEPGGANQEQLPAYER
ncbi:hypothetical protein N3K66_002424 [Trichothecium roseum]|uniref:Uncharacterized protein n=1 Tax=Trichothecium roseum TaxID=47278 RepID=A0ACC0V9H8_9HYPO|nr:hypothetical protein N3K66_002424 [Trichothecium roseum]